MGLQLSSQRLGKQLIRARCGDKISGCDIDCFLEQLSLELTREEAIVDLIPCNTQDLAQEVSVGEPLCNSNHNQITFNILVRGNKPKKSITPICNFRKEKYTKVPKLVRKKN